MPELPEVETVVRELRAGGLIGRIIIRARAFCKPMIAPLTPAAFAARLKGQRVQSIRRRAKYIVLTLSDGDTLLIHLRMTGQLNLARARVAREPHQHIILRLDDGRDLRYRDTRKFGRWLLTRAPEGILGRLGPEPLSEHFDQKVFIGQLRARRRQLKPLLLDQTFLAGIGNIYADEALWTARLHPGRIAATLSATEARRLHVAIASVLHRGIRNQGTTLGQGKSNFQRPGGKRGRNQAGLNVFRRTRLPCLRCGKPIRRMIISQRSTHFCPNCQPARPRAVGCRLKRAMPATHSWPR
ncbi:MAG: bifunctional DNA-formamidopyrimidine glycosylase/DNA-(apurinic or apyrimidinic site) lyase [Kiritimatiellae bacterium]|nr:bifunctional DNA-formamidopyrimidine glycosylase/DNA-(apurinic or apyrimidinic site) lyase [Kiritimatiellia bacterium]